MGGGVNIFPSFDGLPQVATIAAGAVGSGRLVDLPVPSSGRSQIVFVQNVKDYFRWNPTDATAADGKTIVALLANGANPGRYERMGIPAPEWMQQQTWFIDPVSGNDENSATASNQALATDAERQRRMGADPVWILTEYHLRYLNDVPSTDPVNIAGRFAVGNNSSAIFLHGSATNGQGKAVLATLTVDAVTAVNQATNVPLSVTSNGLAVSWTASGLLSARLRFTSGANIGAVMWVASDVGAKTADMIEPQVVPAFSTAFAPPSTNTFTPAVNDAFVAESLVTIGALFLSIGGFGNGFAVNQVIGDSLTVSTFFAASGASLFMWGSRWNSVTSLMSHVKGASFYGCAFGTNGRVVTTSTQTLVNCWAPDDASGFPLFQCGSFGSSVIRFTTWQRNGVSFVGPSPAEFSTSGTKAWNLQSGIGIFNNTAGPGLRLYSANFNASTAQLWGVCGANQVPIQLHTGTWLHYRAIPPGQAGLYFINCAAALNGAWIGFIRDQALVTSAPLFDPNAAIFVAPRVLTPANLQAAIGAGGFNGKFVVPDVNCGMTTV